MADSRRGALLFGLITLIVLAFPSGTADPPGAEPMVVDEVTHAHTEIDAQSHGCSGTYKLVVAAKTVGMYYDWYTTATPSAGGEGAYDDEGEDDPAVVYGGPGVPVPFDLSDGETLSLSAGIWNSNPALPNDSSYDSDSVTCDG